MHDRSDPPNDDDEPGSPPPWERGDAGGAAYRQWTRDRPRFLRAFREMVSADKLRLACAFTEYRNFIEQPITPHHATETLTLWYAALDAAE